MPLPRSIYKKTFLSNVATRILGIQESTLEASAVFTGDKDFTYLGIHYRTTSLPDGNPGQIYGVTTLSGGGEYTYPLDSSDDLASFKSFVAGGSVVATLSLYAPPVNYLIVSGTDLNKLAADVNTYIGKGYTPFGSVFVFSTNVCQPMIIAQS